MIKDFECYKKHAVMTWAPNDRHSMAVIVWRKCLYGGGYHETRIEAYRCTRAMVREAFEAKSQGFHRCVFRRIDSEGLWKPNPRFNTTANEFYSDRIWYDESNATNPTYAEL